MGRWTSNYDNIGQAEREITAASFFFRASPGSLIVLYERLAPGGTCRYFFPDGTELVGEKELEDWQTAHPGRNLCLLPRP